MDTFTEILKSLPKTAFKINAAGNAVVDLTGRSVAMSAVPNRVSPIISGSYASMSLGAPGINFPTTVFIRGQEKRGFSLEAAVWPADTKVDDFAILSHSGVFDGLSISNNYMRFRIEFETLGNLDVTYKIPDNRQRMTVIGTYSPGAMKLIVNGELVGQTEVPDAYIKDGFKTRGSANLYLGPTTNGKMCVIDGVAVYGRALSDAEAYMHWFASNDTLGMAEATAKWRPILFDGTGRSIYSKQTWNKNNWGDALVVDVSTKSDNLAPEIDYTTQLSKAGTWTATYAMPNSDAVAKIYGAKIEWSGAGSFTVDTSVDGGTSWQAATNGRQVTNSWNITPNGTPIMARVSFAGGISSDTSYISQLSITGYDSAEVYPEVKSRKMTLVDGDTTSDNAVEVTQTTRYPSINTFSASNTLISGELDADTTTAIKAFEMWGRVSPIVNGTYIFDNRPAGGTSYLYIATGGKLQFAGGTLYFNGASVASNTATIYDNNAFHAFFVPTTDFVGGFTLTGSSGFHRAFNFIKLYDTVPTASQIAAIYQSYVINPVARLATDSNPVTEGVSAYKTYAYDWSIAQAG